MSKIAIDTNVLLYFLDSSLDKRRTKAAELILQNPIFNSQSLSELINVLNRRWKFPKASIIEIIAKLMEECKYVPITEETIALSFDLVKKYDFQLFDAFIVATALDSGCEFLYTEDLQHGLVIEKELVIFNPFKE
ncbi:PIN domain-containing protein [Aquiflexum sp.]|uniref:PIN domain-containing protein n=1 Tax=Aquiflexum sp. TaxID=1872584 RepID=UPI0035943D6A